MDPPPVQACKGAKFLILGINISSQLVQRKRPMDCAKFCARVLVQSLQHTAAKYCTVGTYVLSICIYTVYIYIYDIPRSTYEACWCRRRELRGSVRARICFARAHRHATPPLPEAVRKATQWTVAHSLRSVFA